jgi:ADP-ribose pyrophosphatase
MTADEPLPWNRLSRRQVYANRWIEVVEDIVALPDGGQTIYGVVRCAEAAGVLPFLDDDTVLLIQQWRYVGGRLTWEMPTGGVHRGESIVDGAQRELAEEVGYRAGRLEHLTSFATSKSVVEETAHLYAAYDLEPAASAPDHTEFIRREAVPFATAREMVLSGEIVDAMTIIAILWADRLRVDRLRRPRRPG